MNEILKSKINTYCYLVRTGKPTAIISIQERYVEETLEIVNKENLNTYIENLCEGWKTVWIYKYEYLLEVIKNMPEKPKSIYDHWVLGKIFGYSDEAIREFIKC